jgi:phospholipid/cholesterol/gamma-HCH transport system substrate-binding protein
VRALDSVDRLSRTLVTQRAKIANVLDNLQPGLDVLNQQRGLLVGTLQSLQRLSGVATDVIRRSQANTVADLQRLEPILGNLIAAGDALPGSLQILLTIPFADNSLNVIKGDFANIDVTLQLNLSDILALITNGSSVPGVDQVFALLQNQQVASSAGTTAAQAATNKVRASNGVPLAIPGLTSRQGSGN